MEARSAPDRPGAMRKVLELTGAHGLAPLHLGDPLPPDVDRRLLETHLHEARAQQAESQGSMQTDRRDEAQSPRE